MGARNSIVIVMSLLSFFVWADCNELRTDARLVRMKAYLGGHVGLEHYQVRPIVATTLDGQGSWAIADAWEHGGEDRRRYLVLYEENGVTKPVLFPDPQTVGGQILTFISNCMDPAFRCENAAGRTGRILSSHRSPQIVGPGPLDPTVMIYWPHVHHARTHFGSLAGAQITNVVEQEELPLYSRFLHALGQRRYLINWRRPMNDSTGREEYVYATYSPTTGVKNELFADRTFYRTVLDPQEKSIVFSPQEDRSLPFSIYGTPPTYKFLIESNTLTSVP